MLSNARTRRRQSGAVRRKVVMLRGNRIPHECECDPCDMNCDGLIGALDIESFIGLLCNGDQPCGPCTGDINGDGVIDALDIEPFLNCLFQ